MLAPPNENCDAAEALSRFPSEDPSVQPAHVATKHLQIESDVRESSVRRPVIVDIDVPADRGVVTGLPMSEPLVVPERAVQWVARRQRRPVVKVQVTVTAFLDRVRNDVEKRWLVLQEARPWRAAFGKPSAATMGSAALAVVLATALLVAILAPAYSASTGERDMAAMPEDEKAPVALPSAVAAITPAPASLSSEGYNFRQFEVPAVASQPLPWPSEDRAAPTPVSAVAVVAVAPPARAVATSGRPAPAVSRAEVTRSDRANFVGSLAIDSEPAGATVFINQRPVGETPVRLSGLSAGSRVVRIEYPGYERWTAAILVAAEKQAQVSARLQPDRADQ